MFLIVAAVLFATTDDRFPGSTADGRQMIWTAVAMAETGEIGQARGRDLTVPRPEGDSVSRFGLAMSVAQVPAAMVAPGIEKRFGPASSQPLFLVAPFVFVMLAAAFSAMTVRELGGDTNTQAAAILLSTLAGPLGAYTKLDASESLQAVSLMVALWASTVAAKGTGSRAVQAAILAGIAAGVALLTKSSLILVAPLTLLPLFTARRSVSTLAAGAGVFAAFVVWWWYLEVARFGSPLMGYAGEPFSHSPVDGAWRLLVGVNKGLLWYFPALIAVAIGVRSLRLRRAVRDAVQFAGISALAALLALASGWWAWHGDDGWGPRLLVPAIPLLAVSASFVIADWGARARFAMVAVSILLNSPALLQHPTPVFHYRVSANWPEVDADLAASVPRFARRELNGKVQIVPEAILSGVPQASPFIVLPWYFAATHGAADSRASRLRQPPWLEARPDITPPEDVVTALAHAPARWRFWGRSFFAGEIDGGIGAYDLGLADQVLRAQSMRSMGRAERLARKLVELAPSGFADALMLESFRLGNRRSEAVQYLTSLSQERRGHAAINVVLALFERDRGNEQAARAFLESVVDSYRGSPVERALSQPLVLWPSDFAAMTRDDRLQVEVR